MDATKRDEVRALVLDIVRDAALIDLGGRADKWTVAWNLKPAGVFYGWTPSERYRAAVAALQHHRRAGRIRYDRERRGWVPVDGGAK